MYIDYFEQKSYSALRSWGVQSHYYMDFLV